jgi:hypothetical protein
MSEQHTIPPQTPPKTSFRERLKVFVRRSLLLLLLLLFVLTTTTIVIINVPSLRQWLVKSVITRVNARLEAKIEFDDFRGSLLSDITLTNVRMIAARDTILSIRELAMRYDVQFLLVQKIMLTTMNITDMRVRLVRSMDSTWNFTHLFALPSATVQPKPFRWHIDVRDLAISQGSVHVYDSLAPSTPRLPAFLLSPVLVSALQQAGFPQHRFNAARATFDSVNLNLSANLNFRKQEHAVSFRHLSFREMASNLAVRNLSLFAYADTSRVELSNVQLLTDESQVRVRLIAENVNLFAKNISLLDSARIHRARFQLSLHADSVSFRDLQRFTPALDQMSDKLALRLDVYGSLANLTLKHAEVKSVERDDPSGLYGKSAQTLASLEGTIQNLSLKIPELRANAGFDIILNPMRLSYNDLARYAPGLVASGKVPNLRGLGMIAIEKGSVKGTARAFDAKLKLTSAAGSIDAESSMDMRPDTIRYKALLNFANLNLAAIANDISLQSRINARARVQGQGFTLSDLKTALLLDASASEIAGRSFDALSLDANAHDGGIINLNTLRIHWNRTADFTLDDDTDDNAAKNADFWASGLLNLQNLASPTYRLEARASRLDLQRLSLFPGSETDASFVMNVVGSGFTSDSMRGNLHFVATDFRTPKKAFEPFTINARLVHLPTPQNPLYREFHLQSELADAHLRGTFTMPSFISSFANEIDNSIFAVRRKYHLVRDSILASTYEGLYIKKPERAVPLNVNFSLLPHDIEISRLFSGSIKLQCRGELHGSMRGTTQDYTFRVDSSDVREFYYTDDATSVEIANAQLQGTFRHTSEGDSLNVVSAEATVRMDSLFRFNDFVFRHVQGSARYTGDTFAFDVRSVFGDSALTFYAKALLDMRRPQGSELTLDSAWMLYRGGMEWSTVGKMNSILNKEGLLIEQLTLKRPRAETAYLSGQIWFDHFSNAQLIVESMTLSDINRLLPEANRIPTLNPLQGTLERLQLTLSGSPAEPRMGLLLNASSVRYNNTYLGSIALEATHQDSTVKGTAEIQNPNLLNEKLKTLTVTAKTFPLNLAFTDVEERLVSQKPIDVRFDATDLPLGALDIFVPAITALQGTGDAHFTISGTTPENIMYRGEAVIPRASFVFEGNNLKYYAEGKATILNKTVTVEHLNLANDQLDYPKGRASANGTISVNGFEITGFDITARIPQQGLFVLGNASRIPNPQLYGDVIVATGAKPFHFYGTLEQPYLRGDVNVLEAKVAFPEIRSVKSENRLFCFETVTKDRTGRTITARDCNQQEYTLLLQKDSAQNVDGAPNIAPKQLSSSELAHFAAEQAIWQQQGNYEGGEMRDEGREKQHSSSVATVSLQENKQLPNVQSILQLSNSLQASNNGLRTDNAPLNFADKIDYALNVNLRGNFSVTMEWGPLEQLVANLGQENPEQPLRYIKTPDRPDEHRLFGDLILREGSTYKYYRIFNASGKVAFNTGVMSNPRLNINALLRGQRTQPDRSGTSEYVVNLGISGTKTAPNLKMSYLLDNVPGVGDSVKIQNDAIMLLLFGRTQDEFALGSGVGEAITQNSSSLASRLLTDLLQGTGVVRSADIFFAGGRTGSLLDMQQARVQFTGEISNLGVLWQVANDIGTSTPNTSFSIDIPFRSFLDQELFRNIVLQITRSAVTSNSSVFLRQQREWEVKIGARNSW